MCLPPSPSPAERERGETLGRAAAVRRRVRALRRSQRESPHPAIETPFGVSIATLSPLARGEGEDADPVGPAPPWLAPRPLAAGR
jgi:hypothetical protein